jgi:hypothetical protein
MKKCWLCSQYETICLINQPGRNKQFAVLAWKLYSNAEPRDEQLRSLCVQCETASSDCTAWVEYATPLDGDETAGRYTVVRRCHYDTELGAETSLLFVCDDGHDGAYGDGGDGGGVIMMM